MLEFLGQPTRHCDGQTRRSFLRAGALGVGGFTLADLLRAENGKRSSTKAVINIHLDGGPPQMDMIDPKPEAPAELRGEFAGIRSKLPGVHLTELMPRMAAAADRFVFLRSLVGSAGRHDGFQCQSGYHIKELAGIGGRPALGCVVDRLLGSSGNAPAFVDLMQGRPLARNSARPGFLGPAYKPFRPDISHLFKRELETGMKGELSRLGEDHQVNLKLIAGLNAERLDDRVGLLQQFDGIRRASDKSGMMRAMDRFNQQAVGILTSGKFADALDLAKEDPKMLEQYTPKIKLGGEQFYTAEGPTSGRKLLMARRLVEAGVPVVQTLLSASDLAGGSGDNWDTHRNHFPKMKDRLLPVFDRSVSALLTDLEMRGMLEETLVVFLTDFGRTPKVNGNGGRDHYPNVYSLAYAGGGIQGGQVYGASNKKGTEPAAGACSPADIHATAFRAMGIDPRTELHDQLDRPFQLCDGNPLPLF